ncbi:MAG: SDR family oxidoreductase [Pseudomonadota bacterium]|nr:SDR family oxidoreductase [Pseudomonadota bacterium]
MDLGLDQKRVAITGSSRGIGLALAQAFLEEGARVMLNGLDPGRLEEARDRFAGFGDRVTAVAADVSRRSGVERLFEEIDRTWGGVDVFVNNAATHPTSDFTVLEEEQWNELMDMNLKSAYLCAQAAFQRMKNQESGGVILNASSFAALIPAYPYGLYSLSKAALISMTKTMAAEFAPWNIRVNAYVPGLIATQMNAETIEKNGDVALAQIALMRPGSVEEVAAPVVFLASSKASYISGAALEISGGKFAVQHPKATWNPARTGG